MKETGYQGKKVIFGIRPEDVSSRPIVQEVYPDANVDAEVVVSELLGAETMLYLKLEKLSLLPVLMRVTSTIQVKKLTLLSTLLKVTSSTLKQKNVSVCKIKNQLKRLIFCLA